MKAQFIKGKYNDDKTITLYLRDEKYRKVAVKVAGFEPYFYVSKLAYVPPNPALKRVETEAPPSIDGIKLKKLVMQTPTDVKNFRGKFKIHYEADIPFIRRFLIDTGIKAGIELPDKALVHYKDLKPIDFTLDPVITYLDIEVYTTTRFPNPERDENKIIIATLYTNTNGKYYTVALSKQARKVEWEKGTIFFLTSEENLLKFIRKYLDHFKPDVLTGWNVSFDINYILHRANKLGIGISLEGMNIFDLLSAYKNLNKKGSNALGDVLNDEGIATEVNYEPFNMQVWERDELHGVKVNVSHVEGIVKLDEKHGLIKFYWGLKNYAGLEDLEPTLYHGVLVDTLLLRYYHKKFALPSKDCNIIKEDESKLGAIVIQPPKGVFEGVAVFDMSRYYPNIIIAYDISPEPHPKEQKGIIPQMVKGLLAEREKYEAELKKLTPGSDEYNRMKNKRNAVKYIAESVFGYLGSTSSRLYSKENFEKITGTGREGLLYLKKVLEEWGYRTLYADTDGIFVQVPFEEVFDIEKRLNQALVDFCKQKGITANLKLKLDRYFDRIVFAGVKKRYAGHVIWEGKEADYTYIVGFEYVRRDAPKLTKELQLKIFDLVLKGKRQEVIDLLRDTIRKFRKGEFPIDDIAIRKTLNKRLEDYNPKPDYVRGSIYANNYLGLDIRGGDMVKMIYIKDIKNLPKTDVLCWIGEFPPVSVTLDIGKMIDRVIKRKVEKLLDLIGISWDEITCKQKTLW